MNAIPGDARFRTARPARAFFTRRWIVCLGIVGLLLVVRLLWGYQTSNALRTELADLRARGEPLVAADFAFIELADRENAAKFHQDAARAAVPNADPPRATNMVYPGYPPYDDAWMAAAERSEEAHEMLFALAREARRHPRARWNAKPFNAPLAVAAGMAANLNAARHLANILADGAELAQVQGNDLEAIERVRDLLHHANSLRSDHTILGQLVAAGLDALACNAAQAIAPGLRLEATSNATSAPAIRNAATGLIAALLDEELLTRGITRNFRFERAVMHELRHNAGAGTWAIRPLAAAQLVREHRNHDVYIDASALPNKPQVMTALARVTVEQPNVDAKGGVPRYSRWFGQPSHYDRYFETCFRVRAERRMTAVSLAAQLFRADHGRWPNALDELVPAYLPAVPLDPFTDGKPLGYVVQRGALPGDADRALVFHTGGEVDIGPYPQPSYGWEIDRRPGVKIRKDLWQYRDLARFVPPREPASTQAVDDQP